LINNGTIRGGNGPLNGAGGRGTGVAVHVGVSQIANTGTIDGYGAFAIGSIGSTANIILVTSGTIRTGAGQAGQVERHVRAAACRALGELTASHANDKAPPQILRRRFQVGGLRPSVRRGRFSAPRPAT
jgi:hypothetical protein